MCSLPTKPFYRSDEYKDDATFVNAIADVLNSYTSITDLIDINESVLISELLFVCGIARCCLKANQTMNIKHIGDFLAYKITMNYSKFSSICVRTDLFNLVKARSIKYPILTDDEAKECAKKLFCIDQLHYVDDLDFLRRIQHTLQKYWVLVPSNKHALNAYKSLNTAIDDAFDSIRDALNEDPCYNIAFTEETDQVIDKIRECQHLMNSDVFFIVNSLITLREETKKECCKSDDIPTTSTENSSESKVSSEDSELFAVTPLSSKMKPLEIVISDDDDEPKMSPLKPRKLFESKKKQLGRKTVIKKKIVVTKHITIIKHHY